MSEIYRRAILEQVVIPDRRLGRHVHHDEKSKDFVAETAATVKSVLHTSLGLPIDQAAVGACTGDALVGAGNSKPNLKSTAPARTQKDAYAVYATETRLEGAPWPPNDPGGSGLMVCKAGKQMGWLSSYRHAFGLEMGLRALVLRPVIIGIDWYDSFDHPDKNGLVTLPNSATIRGGHEIVLTQIIADRELVGAVQSWGPKWGVPDKAAGLLGGRFYIPFAVLDTLLQNQGDVTVPYFV